jgi:hypothetical protein
MSIKPNLELGYGLAKGEDAFAVGVEAARQALLGIKEYPLAVVQVFASVRYNLEELLQGIRTETGEAPLIGASTAGEICNGVQEEAVVVVALASPYLRVKVGVGSGVSQDWQQALIEAITSPQLLAYFATPDSTVWSTLTLQGASAFAILFSPGATHNSDSRSFDILEALNRLSQDRLPILGAGAADGWRLEGNYVFWGSQVFRDSLLVAVFETSLRFGISMAHGFQPTSQRAMVTCGRGQEVLELDGQPAAEVYSRMQGLPRESLKGRHLTLTTGRPMGIADPYGQYSINVATSFTDNGGVLFTQPVPEGVSMTLMAADQDRLVAAGSEALRKALLRGSIRDLGVVLVFSSALRTRILGERLGEEITGMMDLVPRVPVLGFYSDGEQGLADDGVNRHNCEVVAVLALGRELSYSAEVALENERLHLEVEYQEFNRRRTLQRLKQEIVDRQKTEEKLRKSEELFNASANERAQLENKLAQAQQLEALGRLAGGVAHDFNNMLTAIMGYCEIVMMSFREDDPIFFHLEGIKKSADRAAAMTRQLLTFSRQQLPWTEEVAGAPGQAALSAPSLGSETVLVVEDEEILLELIKDALEMNGFRVLAANSAREAMDLCARHSAPIHLMLTDVVMPEKSGRELADALSALHPEMKILYMSGYTADATVVGGLVDAALPFIQKPFPPMDLVRKVRELIDRTNH